MLYRLIPDRAGTNNRGALGGIRYMVLYYIQYFLSKFYIMLGNQVMLFGVCVLWCSYLYVDI